MNINIKGTGIELTESIRDYATKKVLSLGKYFKDDSVLSIHVEVGKTTKHHKSGDVFRAEIRVVGGGANVYVAQESEDLYSSIDLAEDEASRQIVSSKGRHIRLMRQGQRAMKYMIKGIADSTTKGLNRIKFFRKKKND